MNGDESAFLAAIRDRPYEQVIRLAYADWLEERADPRCEMIRVCETMRELPVYSNAYWELKARRNEMRRVCSADWLAATGYDGSRYDAIFRHGFPDGWRERWRVIREYTERWHGIAMGDVGGRREEIAAEECRIDRALSPSIREYIAYAHDVFPSPDDRRVHRDPYTLGWLPDQPALSLMTIAEGNVNWVIHADDLIEDDPIVRTYYWARGDETRYVPDAQGWTEGRVSNFVLGFTEAYSDRSEFSATVRNVTALREELEAAFPIRRLSQPDAGSYETEPGIVACFYKDHWNPRQSVLSVAVRPGVSWEAIPAFLWPYARRRSMCRGMFLSQQDVDQGLQHWGDGPLPAGMLREAVPPMRLPASPEITSGAEDEIPF